MYERDENKSKMNDMLNLVLYLAVSIVCLVELVDHV